MMNSINRVLTLALLLTALVASAQKSKGTATIKGTMKGFPSVVPVEIFSELQHMVSKGYLPNIYQTKDSSFEVTLELNEPTYFRIGRNKLYLSPGDNMVAELNNNNAAFSKFTGQGSAANNYLTNTPFPKAGSFLETGRNIKETPQETLSVISEIAKKRNQEIQALLRKKSISKEFARLETARNRADLIMSIVKTPIYLRSKLYSRPEEIQEAYLAEFIKISTPLKDSLLQGFIDPSLLQLEVYRDLYSYLPVASWKNQADVQIMHDFEKANTIAFNKIKPTNNKAQLPGFQPAIDSIGTKKYRDALNLLIAEKSKFGTGDIAEDFTVRKPDGTTTTLSSLKGTVIYLDLWATWCGPCLAEMPHLEKLKEKFAGNSNISIVSLSVDDNDPVWLKNLASRKPDGIQWRIDRAKLTSYEVETIPRYILIDKNFVVTEMQALHASDPAVADLLEKMAK